MRKKPTTLEPCLSSFVSGFKGALTDGKAPIAAIGLNHQRRAARPLRVGLFGIGLEAYWPQFKGLKERLQGYIKIVHNRLRHEGAEIVNLGLIDSPAKALERV